MSKPLVIVESPAKARTIGKFLGPTYTVKASMGHVRDLPKSGLAIDIENGFDLTWAPIPDRAKVLKDLKERIAKADILYLATDPDREGEAIAWHLVESLLDDKNRDEIDVKRVVFHEITNAAIKEAFEHPSDVNVSRVDAYRTRRILDRLMGYQLSPLLWKKLARGLSAGRVQSVAVRLVVEREREIRDFVPEEYWRIVARFGAGDDAFEAEFARLDGERFALTDAARAGAVLERLLRGTSGAPGAATLVEPQQIAPTAADPHPQRLTAYYEPLHDVDGFVVTKLEQKARVDRPKPPFITSTLQQAAAGRYGFAAKRTMRIAQQLYEGIDLPGEGAVGLITYMRTDSVAISNQARGAAARLIPKLYGDRYLPEKPNFYRSKKGAQEAHEAIRPTDPERLPERLRSALTDEQAKLYDLIWRRFMASQMAPAESLVTSVELTREGAAFDATGRVTTFDGYTRVWGRDSADQQLPELREGLSLTANEVPATQHFTTPPRRYTEASLVRALEKYGIGRPSTYASILSTITDRGYVDHGEEAAEDEARRQYLEFGDQAPDAAAIAAAEAEREAGEDDDEAPVDRADRRQKRSRAFHATHLGEVVTDLLLPYFGEIVDTEFTANMETQLDQVAEGEIPWRKVVDDFYARFAADLKAAEDDMKPYWQRPILLPDMKCGKVPDEGGRPCEAPMAILFNRFGAYLGCSRYPDCKNTVSLTGRPKAAAELTEHTCRKRNETTGVVCGRPMERKVNRWGKAFLACTGFKSKDCDGSVSLGKSGEPLWPEETSVPCPDCGATLVVKRSRRGKFLACPRFPKCRGTLSLPACTHESKTGKACGKPMTEPADGGRMACPAHPEVKLEPPKKVRADDAAAKGALEGDGAATPRKAAGRKASARKTTTKKKTTRRKPASS